MRGECILKGVPKVHYRAFGGITPFPICLKAVSDYLGDKVDYTYAITACGAAFRFTWNTQVFDGGNVDIMHSYKSPEDVFRYGINALGRTCNLLWRDRKGPDLPNRSNDKDEFKELIREQIDSGRPVISLGPIGPPEAGLITGYRDSGDTLLGWSVFQDWDANRYSDEGYFLTDSWWESDTFFGIITLSDVLEPRYDLKTILTNAVSALTGRMDGIYAKGIAAYEPWKKAILGVRKSDFSITGDGLIDDSNVMMCQGDATDCLIDGRKNACQFFMRLSEANPGQPLYARIANQFGIVASTINTKIYGILGGYDRGPAQIKALAQQETREQIAVYIDELKAADEKALSLMKELLGQLSVALV